MRILAITVATIALLFSSSGVASADDTSTIYDSLKLAPNIPSVGPEAYAFRELGDEVTFAGSARTLDRVVVTLSSWACQGGHWYTADCATQLGATYSLPITLKIYQHDASEAAGALIASQTRTVAVPYRPSSDPLHCSGGRWWAGPTLGCFNGLEWLVIFDFRAQNITLPSTVVYGVSYDSTHYGPNPVGEAAACYTSSGGCFYDSLNIGLAPKVNVGTKAHPGTLYQNAYFSGQYCDGGVADVMRLDSPTSACWTGSVPAVRFTARGGSD